MLAALGISLFVAIAAASSCCPWFVEGPNGTVYTAPEVRALCFGPCPQIIDNRFQVYVPDGAAVQIGAGNVALVTSNEIMRLFNSVTDQTIIECIGSKCFVGTGYVGNAALLAENNIYVVGTPTNQAIGMWRASSEIPIVGVSGVSNCTMYMVELEGDSGVTGSMIYCGEHYYVLTSQGQLVLDDADFSQVENSIGSGVTVVTGGSVVAGSVSNSLTVVATTDMPISGKVSQVQIESYVSPSTCGRYVATNKMRYESLQAGVNTCISSAVYPPMNTITGMQLPYFSLPTLCDAISSTPLTSSSLKVMWWSDSACTTWAGNSSVALGVCTNGTYISCADQD